MARGKRCYCFTYYGTKQRLLLLESHTNFRYLCAQQETCPTTNLLHWQGYVEFTQAVRITTIRNIVVEGEESFHCESRRGTQAEAIDYTKKDDTAIPDTWFELGVPAQERDKFPRKVTDEILRSMSSKSIEDIVDDLGDIGLMKRKTVEEYIKLKQSLAKRLVRRTNALSATLYNWQERALTALESQTDRKILWIYDTIGNSGKSWFAKYLKLVKDATVATSGRSQDIVRMLDENTVDYVVFDFSRDTNTMPYALCEQLKNGLVTSPKYDSKTLEFDGCRLLVLANCEPDGTKWSKDRYMVWELVSRAGVIGVHDHTAMYVGENEPSAIADTYNPQNDLDGV
jgi:hypothetical protein